MYSLEDQSCDAALLIRSVVAEEMLHAALAANLLLAIGGDPKFAATDLIPKYPGDLPHHRPRLTLNLSPCTKQQVDELFLVIEQPETHSAIPDDDVYDSLGQFYHAIERGMATVAESHDLFVDPQQSRQMSQRSYYSPVTFDAEGSGGLGLIENIASANEAIHVIIHQGEGVSDEKWADPLHQELTHYHKFLQISTGEAPIGKVAPMPMNPRTADFPPDVQAVSNLFNAAYRYLYLVMHELFQPQEDRGPLITKLYTVMSDILSPVAHKLVQIPLESGGVAAPTFEVYEFRTADPRQELADLAIAAGPDLSTVGAAIDGL